MCMSRYEVSSPVIVSCYPRFISMFLFDSQTHGSVGVLVAVTALCLCFGKSVNQQGRSDNKRNCIGHELQHSLNAYALQFCPVSLSVDVLLLFLLLGRYSAWILKTVQSEKVGSVDVKNKRSKQSTKHGKRCFISFEYWQNKQNTIVLLSGACVGQPMSVQWTLFSRRKPWSAAQVVCEMMGGYLASPDTPHKLSAFVHFLNNSHWNSSLWVQRNVIAGMIEDLI